MKDNDWYIIAIESVITVTGLAAIIFKISWLLAVFGIICGIAGILASIFKWEDVLFYDYFWIDLDENLWFRILNAIIGAAFVIGGLCVIIFHHDFWK